MGSVPQSLLAAGNLQQPHAPAPPLEESPIPFSSRRVRCLPQPRWRGVHSGRVGSHTLPSKTRADRYLHILANQGRERQAGWGVFSKLYLVLWKLPWILGEVCICGFF